MSTPEEPEELAQESAQDETPEAAADDVTAEAAQEAAEAEAKPKPVRRRPAAKDKAPDEDAVSEDTEAQGTEAQDAVEETGTEAPAKAPAKRTTRKPAAAKPKRAAAVASFSLVDADLPGDIFDAQGNVPLIHQVGVAQQAAARQGTHATKTRGDVRGGGRKPYRQKGTGRARQGSTRAPQFAGGGIVHGPVPRSYAQKTPKKMKAAALRGALSDRARHGLVQVVSGFVDGESPKTADAVAVLRAVTGARAGTSTVLVVADSLTRLSLRNAPGVHVLNEGQLNTRDVLISDHVVFTQAALDAFVARTTGTREDAQQ